VKILAVIPLYPPHHLGGYEVVCRGVMERFAASGHDVLVLTSDSRLPDRDEDDRGSVAVERALRGWWDWESHGALNASLPQRVAIERHNQRVAKEVLARFRPDVISVWSLVYMSFSVVTLMELAGVPMVMSLGDDGITYAPALDEWTRVFEKRPFLRPLGRAMGLETRLPTFAGTAVAAASEMISDSVDRVARWRFRDVAVIRMGIETRDFPLADPHPERWDWRLLFVGRVVPNKGIATAIRALALLPDEARLDVDGYGAPELIEELTTLAHDLGVSERVRFMRSPRAELADRYRDADVVVFPSEWPEPFGLVPLEAMARGTPVVATGTGGSGEMLFDGDNCLLFPPGDADALAAAVRRLADDPELRRTVAEGGSRTASDLTLDRYAERLEELHVAAAGGSSALRDPRASVHIRLGTHSTVNPERAASTFRSQNSVEWRLTVPVAAPPETVYGLVSDPTRAPQWSKECVAVEWLDGASGRPVPGARFRGHNRRRADRWTTTGEVVTADAPSVFSFHTLAGGRPATRWTFTLAPSPDGEGTELTEAVEQLAEPSVYRKVRWRWLGGIRDREADLLDNLRRSLAAIKELVER